MTGVDPSDLPPQLVALAADTAAQAVEAGAQGASVMIGAFNAVCGMFDPRVAGVFLAYARQLERQQRNG